MPRARSPIGISGTSRFETFRFPAYPFGLTSLASTESHCPSLRLRAVMLRLCCGSWYSPALALFRVSQQRIVAPAIQAPSNLPVAVGTALSGRPPHRSQRALLAHWAPASGRDAKSLVRPFVQGPG